MFLEDGGGAAGHMKAEKARRDLTESVAEAPSGRLLKHKCAPLVGTAEPPPPTPRHPCPSAIEADALEGEKRSPSAK
jgi:hypothetical protein